MASYNVNITEELDTKLKDVAETCGSSPENLLSDFVEIGLKDYFVEFIIKKYKDGDLKARDAWKASGLDYQEFQNRVQN